MTTTPTPHPSREFVKKYAGHKLFYPTMASQLQMARIEECHKIAKELISKFKIGVWHAKGEIHTFVFNNIDYKKFGMIYPTHVSQVIKLLEHDGDIRTNNNVFCRVEDGHGPALTHNAVLPPEKVDHSLLGPAPDLVDLMSEIKQVKSLLVGLAVDVQRLVEKNRK